MSRTTTVTIRGFVSSLGCVEGDAIIVDGGICGRWDACRIPIQWRNGEFRTTSGAWCRRLRFDAHGGFLPMPDLDWRAFGSGASENITD